MRARVGARKRKNGLYLCLRCRHDFLREEIETHRPPRSDSYYKKKKVTGVRHAPKWCKPTFGKDQIKEKTRNRAGKGRRKNRAKK